jgi:hypothetical protein
MAKVHAWHTPAHEAKCRGRCLAPGGVPECRRSIGRDSRRGHAGDLSFASDGTVEVLFSHAVFEHVYPAHRLTVLREWRRVVAPEGVIICLGLPDFEAIAKAYLAGGPGTTGTCRSCTRDCSTHVTSPTCFVGAGVTASLLC